MSKRRLTNGETACRAGKFLDLDQKGIALAA
jgi:hypothetical protein